MLPCWTQLSYIRLSNVYLPLLVERVSTRYVLEAAGILYRSASISVFSFVTACNNKKFVPYLYVILLVVSKTSTFNSQNTIYLEIYGSGCMLTGKLPSILMHIVIIRYAEAQI